MSKHWTPPSHNVAVRKSRIRREPLRTFADAPAKRRTAVRSDETEMAFGVTGILLFAAGIAAAVVAIGYGAGFYGHAPVAGGPSSFGQCYNTDGGNCVVDGDTFYKDGARVQVADLAAPGIDSARCRRESEQGVAAALKLADLLNSGPVTVGPSFTDKFGRTVSKVEVRDHDVADKMVNAGVARRYHGKPENWC